MQQRTQALCLIKLVAWPAIAQQGALLAFNRLF